jgi:hypothetical protein
MKNSINNIFVLAAVMFVALGCNYVGGNLQNVSSVQDAATNTNSTANVARDTLGLKKSGIAECDELVDLLAERRRQNAGQEQSWTDRAAEEVVKQLVYDQLSKNDPNRTPQEKADLAKNCKTALEYLR